MSDQIMRAGSELGAIVPEVWSSNFYETLLPAIPWNGSVDRRYEGEIRALGDTVNASQFPQFDRAQTIPEGARNDAEAVTVTQKQLVVDNLIVKDYMVTDVAMLQSLEHSNQLRDLASFAILKEMQKIIIDEIAPSASSPDHDITYDTPLTLALADMIESKTLLDDANVPDANRVMSTGSKQWNDIWLITGFVSRDFVSTEFPNESGALPARILGFAPNYTTENNSSTYFYHPSFMQVAVQRGLNVSVHDVGGQGIRAMRVNVDTLMGLSQFSDLRVVRVS